MSFADFTAGAQSTAGTQPVPGARMSSGTPKDVHVSRPVFGPSILPSKIAKIVAVGEPASSAYAVPPNSPNMPAVLGPKKKARFYARRGTESIQRKEHRSRSMDQGLKSTARRDCSEEVFHLEEEFEARGKVIDQQYEQYEKYVQETAAWYHPVLSSAHEGAYSRFVPGCGVLLPGPQESPISFEEVSSSIAPVWPPTRGDRYGYDRVRPFLYAPGAFNDARGEAASYRESSASTFDEQGIEDLSSEDLDRWITSFDQAVKELRGMNDLDEEWGGDEAAEKFLREYDLYPKYSGDTNNLGLEEQDASDRKPRAFTTNEQGTLEPFPETQEEWSMKFDETMELHNIENTKFHDFEQELQHRNNKVIAYLNEQDRIIREQATSYSFPDFSCGSTKPPARPIESLDHVDKSAIVSEKQATNNTESDAFAALEQPAEPFMPLLGTQQSSKKTHDSSPKPFKKPSRAQMMERQKKSDAELQKVTAMHNELCAKVLALEREVQMFREKERIIELKWEENLKAAMNTGSEKNDFKGDPYVQKKRSYSPAEIEWIQELQDDQATQDWIERLLPEAAGDGGKESESLAIDGEDWVEVSDA
ncbi:hypothetical protein D6D01_09528 [Aureobasidium pullulans]|uniref:Uncharacterized protein n=1 Tax=Aureobasidium pullulans TaxID=5580 RepID=A0A4S9K1Y6_AURPU|nr:hypothetical protein D6D01_09528 [Aureobasidium pullulans]